MAPRRGSTGYRGMSCTPSMDREDHLGAIEEDFCRDLMRIVLWLPQRLDADLVRTTGITVRQYMTLMYLSETPDQEMRIADLANSAALSASRMSRVVDELQKRGLVTKRASSEDRRGNVAKLTPAGRAKLKLAGPVHSASIRERVFDHMKSSTVAQAAQALSEVVAILGQNPLNSSATS